MAKICLDAGHYGLYNRSPGVKEYYESTMNWKLHLMLKEELEALGHSVTTTRADKDKDLGLYNRGAASKNHDLFLSLHSNAVGSKMNESVDYPVVIVQLDGNGDKLGLELAKAVAELMQTKQAGKIIKKKGSAGEYYGVLRGAAAVGTMGMIIEHSFHTNTAATKWLLVEANLKKMAKREAEIIHAYFGGSATAPQPLKYTKEDFVREVQAATGSKVDGIVGDETISNTPTISAKKNNKHPVVKPVQKWLNALGYTEVGTADGIAGTKFTSALSHFQYDNDCFVDGEAAEWSKTWHKLLK